MTKRLTKILSLLFVFAILASTVSATDIITGVTALRPPDAEPNAPDRCYVEVLIKGTYKTYWSNGGMLETSFEPKKGYPITNVSYNGHSHTGTLTTWQLWDDGASSTGYYKSYEVPSWYDYCYVYEGATAKYSGYLECVS